MNSVRIQVFLVLAVALFGAIYLGYAAATAQFEAAAWVVGGIGLTICLALGRRIWLMMPFMTTIGLAFPLPGQPNTHLVGQIIVILFSILLFLTRRLPVRFKFTSLEFWMLMLIACVLQVYMRNPVGLNAFGSQMVGGKPYFFFALNTIVALIMVSMVVPPVELKWVMRLTIVAAAMNFVLSVVGYYSPGIGKWIGTASYSAIVGEDTSKAVDDTVASRIGFMASYSEHLGRLIISRISPLMCLFHPLWLFLMITTFAGAAVSGFRSVFGTLIMTYIIGLLYRGGFVQLVVSALMAAVLLAGVSIVNMITPLPPNIQRSLSFLPGTWDQKQLLDAEGSSEWRFEMWRLALTSDKYIRNKWLGDGLGMTIEQLQKSLALKDQRARGIGGLDTHRESVMISGDFHSGPVQTIRVIGYVGLIVLLINFVVVGVHAHRQILRCRGTEWYPYALFIFSKAIFYPFVFVFIFGDFMTGTGVLMVMIGYLRLFEKCLPIPAYQSANANYAPRTLPVSRPGSQRAIS